MIIVLNAMLCIVFTCNAQFFQYFRLKSVPRQRFFNTFDRKVFRANGFSIILRSEGQKTFIFITKMDSPRGCSGFVFKAYLSKMNINPTKRCGISWRLRKSHREPHQTSKKVSFVCIKLNKVNFYMFYGISLSRLDWLGVYRPVSVGTNESVGILDGRVLRLCGECAMRVNKIANQSTWAFVFATELMYCGLRWFEMKSSNLQLKSSKELHRPPSFSGGFCLPLSL